jgi:hypothetical protein
MIRLIKPLLGPYQEYYRHLSLLHERNIHVYIQ